MHRTTFLIVILLLTACNTAVPTTSAPTTGAPIATQPPPAENPAAAATATSEPSLPPRTTPTSAPATEAVADEADAEVVAEEAIEVPITPPVTENVAIAATDGLAIQATYYGPGGIAPFPGVILLHMLGDNRTVWDNDHTGFAQSLTQNGYAVLAVDMRGHGDTGGGTDWPLAADDLLQVWDSFTSRDTVDASRTAIVGASIGANMALRTTASQPQVATAVLLSPGLDYRGVTTEDAIPGMGQRPLFIVASDNDTYAANSSRTLADAAGETAVLHTYATAGHGTNMFAAAPDLADRILEWLNTHLHASPTAP